MPDPNPKDSNEESNQDSVDLSDLKSFSFGTQWTEASKSQPSSGKPRFNKGGERHGRSSGGPGGAPRKDRRPPRPPRSQAPVGEASQQDRGQPGGGEGRRQFRRGGRPEGHRGHGHQQFLPYESPVFDVCFYPEDNCFSAIIKAMRANHLTYELFHVAKLFMEKSDRFVASITRKAEKGEKPEKVFMCALDNMPFASEEEVLAHAMANHVEEFFAIDEVEVEPPSGNFPFVNRCPFTKVLLGPPNYHKYEVTLRNHHRTRLPNMAFEKLQSSIETVREEEVVNAWLEDQKKSTRYTTKAAEGEDPKVFLETEDAMGYLRSELRSRIVKQVNYARVHGTVLEKFEDSEAYKAMDGERKRQQRFPLDTANAIRGRMRREKFSIYKKGSKGVTYVCSTKRNFRSPGQVMSPDLDRIIRFLESNQNLKAKEMPVAYEAWLKSEDVEDPFDEKKMYRDLHWLIADGYVGHFEDDSLFAQPVLDAGSKGGDAKPKAPASPERKSEEASSAPSASAATTVTESKSEAVPATEESPKTEAPEATPASSSVEEAPAADAEPEVSEPESEPKSADAPSTEKADAEETKPEAEVAEEAKTESAVPESTEKVEEEGEGEVGGEEGGEASKAQVAGSEAAEAPSGAAKAEEPEEPKKS